ncbi:hypothetical protein DFA_07220 [Cavenderia fasciculata]|uniref:3-hydroxy-3-methylglutaryl coenzyme A reductase n=1 Tax=Cavenderia fasciculata TaxID=261658 RepID=F4PVT9_CACFS|nr:uncharacterized protein DFA_07220 [Cavenderia fasciculata]EGG20103.1 hypothetical protein DFA_07220 [Cavenderia fasciculata]|eukprot:XP_004367086.1 hypothetical protein DFA_07220 [Cavenderia fasciculata]
MSVRELFPFFKWGFNIRRSNFLVPILSNNIIVTGEEAVSFEKPLPARDPSQIVVVDKAQQQSNSTCISEQKSQQTTNSNTTPNSPAAVLAEKKDRFSPSSPESSNANQNHNQNKKDNNNNNNNKIDNNIEQQIINENNTEIMKINSTTPPPSPSSPSSKISDQSNEEIIEKIEKGMIQLYKLEAELGDCSRAVVIRRTILEKNLGRQIEALPHETYDFEKVQGACCENVIGYVPIPVGAAGPLLLNGQTVTIPMATTEGCLVASTHRGCKAISESGGARCTILSRGMTRAPVVRFPNITLVGEFVQWVNATDNFVAIKQQFESTSRFAKLTNIKTTVAGRSVYIRFKCDTGDAMGMNMVSKGVDSVLSMLRDRFADLEIVSLSGNMCTDKKPSAINWIDGRGRSVVCEAVITGDIVRKLLKTSVQGLVDLNISKNLVGSAMAGSIGGFNAHASNIVTAIFLATGQDCAQNVESSNCITLMEACNDGQDLYMTVTMPSIEVGTVGGGTFLPAQSSCLDIIGVRGSSTSLPAGSNADQLAKTICAAVMAGELSLMSALSAGTLMQSHLQLNRKQQTTTTQNLEKI